MCTNFESQLVELGGEDDHLYLLVSYSPKVVVSFLLNILNGVPSRIVRQKNYPSIRKKTLRNGALVCELLCRKL